MSYSEFPHWDENAKHDLKEMICLYNSLVDKYAGTLEQINAVNNRLDEYIANQDAAFARWKSEMLTAVDERVRQDIIPLTNRIAEVERKFDALVATTASQIDDVKNYIDAELGRFEIRVSTVETKTNTAITQVNGLRVDMNRQFANEAVARDAAIDAKATEIRNWTIGLIEQLNTRIDNIECASNVATIEWLWNNAIGCCGMSCIEWYNYQTFTCESWNITGITCLEWYIDGAKITRYVDYCDKMLSPISGNLLPKYKVIIELARLIRPCGITAEEYDRKQIRAGDYDSKFISAYKYDMCGKEIVRNEFKQDT